MVQKMKNLIKTASLGACALSIGLLLGQTYTASQRKPLPIYNFKIERDAYDLVYDGQHKQAKWVYEHLTADKIKSNSDRTSFDFQEDPAIPKLLRATKADYAGSGFDRGHLCPAADASSGGQAMKETFYLSNVSPQCPKLNRGYWSQLERHVRELAKKYNSIHVFTGGLYLPELEPDGKRYVRYQVIGENDVAVPTHYFKIILNDAHEKIEVFMIPNEPINGNASLESFMTTLEKVEKASGIVFIPKWTSSGNGI